MRKLIAIMTCHARLGRAYEQWSTWGRAVCRHADVKFFTGRLTHEGPCGPELDEVRLDVPDDYRGIPLKVQSIMKWAVEHCYDRVMKCDDDVFVLPDRFARLPGEQYDYVGRFRKPYGTVYPVHFASGFAYWLSNRAATAVAETPWNGDWIDERFVATALARRGIFGHHDGVNYVASGPHVGSGQLATTLPYCNATVFCEYNAAQMRDLWENRLTFSKDHAGVTLSEVPHVEVTDAILNSKPGDDVPPHKLGRRD